MKTIFTIILLTLLTACGGGGGSGDTADQNTFVDTDGDGASDQIDAFPDDPAEQKDTDGDGIGDNGDAFPTDATESKDTDGDGVGDNADAFPTDASESRDTDGDGVGDNSDQFPNDGSETQDTDGDGIGDNADVFPNDPLEQYDFDGDGIGDNSDTDNNNDATPDSDETFIVIPLKARYVAGSNVITAAIGVDADGNRMLGNAEQGWHIQYYTYDASNPGTHLSSYTNDGYFNAYFNGEKQQWEITFPAYKNAGNFFTEITLYCSNQNGTCNDLPYEEYKKTFHYKVVCPESGCSDALDPPPGVQITNTVQTNDSPLLYTRDNGSLITTFRSFTGAGVVNQTALSSDNGATWSSPQNISTFALGSGSIDETTDQTLIMFTTCASDGACYLTSSDGLTWTQNNVLEVTDFHNCNTSSCDVNDISIGGFLIAGENNYLVSYSFQHDIYISQSTNLINWADPIQLTNTAGELEWEFDSQLIQHASNYWLSYVSYTDDAIVVTKSSDGVSWTEHGRVALSPHLHMVPRLISDGSKLVLTYGHNSTFYKRTITGSGISSAEVLDTNRPFKPSTTLLSNGTIGGVFEQDLNEQRDLFFKNYGTP